jgi:hypothetical protein
VDRLLLDAAGILFASLTGVDMASSAWRIRCAELLSTTFDELVEATELEVDGAEDAGLAWIRLRTYGNSAAEGCKVARR